MAAIALFPGAFDPITLGHLDVIQRVRPLFDGLIVAVGINPDKAGLGETDRRVALVRAVIPAGWDVGVESFSGLTVHFARQRGACVIVRGVRGAADIDYELTMARANRALAPEIDTLFVPASEQYSHVSSSLIRQIARWGNRDELRRFVPEPVIEALLSRA
jgi:pantetheine-phosphate adenylyltransferase